MLLVDYRRGSAELAPALTQAGLQTEVVTLDYGDVAFTGRGPVCKTVGKEFGKETSVDIGIELKVLPDLVSSLRTGRLAGHQLPGLVRTYDHTWLVIEGQWTANKIGQVSQYHGPRRGWSAVPGKMHAAELENRVLTLELKGGLHVRYTAGRRDTVRFIASLYRWWTDRAYDEHRSHLAVHQPATLIPISSFRQSVWQWPGVGLEWSAVAEREFHTIYRAARASVDEWAQLVHTSKGKTRHFGRAAAERLVRYLRGED